VSESRRILDADRPRLNFNPQRPLEWKHHELYYCPAPKNRDDASETNLNTFATRKAVEGEIKRHMRFSQNYLASRYEKTAGNGSEPRLRHYGKPHARPEVLEQKSRSDACRVGCAHQGSRRRTVGGGLSCATG